MASSSRRRAGSAPILAGYGRFSERCAGTVRAQCMRTVSPDRVRAVCSHRAHPMYANCFSGQASDCLWTYPQSEQESRIPPDNVCALSQSPTRLHAGYGRFPRKVCGRCPDHSAAQTLLRIVPGRSTESFSQQRTGISPIIAWRRHFSEQCAGAARAQCTRTVSPNRARTVSPIIARGGVSPNSARPSCAPNEREQFLWRRSRQSANMPPIAEGCRHFSVQRAGTFPVSSQYPNSVTIVSPNKVEPLTAQTLLLTVAERRADTTSR